MSGFHSRRAQLYHLAMALCPHARDAELEPFVARLPKRDGKLVIADIACGDGYLTKHLKKVHPGNEFVAIEPSDELLISLQRLGISECVHTLRLANLPLQSARFDCVVSLAAMHHVIHKKRVFCEVARILRPGATFIIGDVCDDTPAQRFFDDVVARYCITGHDFDFLDEPSVRHLAAKTGFQHERSEVVDTPWRFPNKERALDFVRDLLGLRIERDALEPLLLQHLACEQLPDGTFALPWQLGYHVLRAVGGDDRGGS